MSEPTRTNHVFDLGSGIVVWCKCGCARRIEIQATPLGQLHYQVYDVDTKKYEEWLAQQPPPAVPDTDQFTVTMLGP